MRTTPLTPAELVAADEELLAGHPNLFSDEPLCPNCGHNHASHWNGGIPGISWTVFSGTNLSRNDDPDGESESVTCPKCGVVYLVIQNVERIVTRRAVLPPS